MFDSDHHMIRNTAFLEAKTQHNRQIPQCERQHKDMNMQYTTQHGWSVDLTFDNFESTFGNLLTHLYVNLSVFDSTLE
jgi:hypothetical protein